MRSYRGPAGQEERQRRKAAIIVRLFQISVQNRICAPAQAVAIQVHQQECEIVNRIDTGELVAEFDGVERHRFVVEETDIVQMQVAMHAAHKARLPAVLKNAFQLFQP